MSGGIYHSIALKSDGTVVAWGDNSFGQCNVPSGLTGVTAIYAGGNHNLALKSDGTVVAWGNNDHGQRVVPSGLSGVVGLGGGFSHSLALKSDGTVVAWGNNDNGQINVPGGLTGVTSVAGGYAHSLALKLPAISVAVPRSILAGGASTTGTVTLPAAAGSGGVTVTLSSNQAGLTVPVSTTVAAGLTTATFTLTAGVTATEYVATVRASSSGYASGTSTVNVVGPRATYLSFTKSEVNNGGTSSARLLIGAVAPTGGYVVNLSSSDPTSLSVPTTVTVPEGETKVDFLVTGNAATANKTVTVTATPSWTTVTRSIVVKANADLSSVDLTNPTIRTGGSTLATVTLSVPAGSGGQAVTLTSSNSAVSVPASVTVSAGQTTATFTATSTGSASTTARIRGTVGKTLADTTLTVKQPVISSVSMSPAVVNAGGTTTFTVNLAVSAPAGGVVVNLISANTAFATVQSTVLVPEGHTSATATVTTIATATSPTVIIQAQIPDGVFKPATLHISHPVLKCLALSPNSVVGGVNSTLTVTLSAAAAVDTVVSLSSDDSVATVSTTVTIPAGHVSAQTIVTTNTVASRTLVHISGVIAGQPAGSAKSATLAVTK